MQVHFRRETHAFSLSEFPAVIGMFFLPPGDYILAVLAGLRGGVRPDRLALREAGLQPRELRAHRRDLDRHRPDDRVPDTDRLGSANGWRRSPRPSSRRSLSSVTIALVITLSGGAPQFQKLPEMIQFGSMVALANTSLALLAVTVLWLDPDPVVAAGPAARDDLRRLPGVHLRAREARATRAAVRVVADPAALAGDRLDTRRAAQPRADDVPCRARRGRALPTLRGCRGPVGPVVARPRARDRERRRRRAAPAAARPRSILDRAVHARDPRSRAAGCRPTHGQRAARRVGHHRLDWSSPTA